MRQASFSEAAHLECRDKQQLPHKIDEGGMYGEGVCAESCGQASVFGERKDEAEGL